MKLEVKNVKSFIGREGYGYSCSLYIDGVKSAVILEDASGGPTDVYQTFDEEKLQHFQKVAETHPDYYSPEGFNSENWAIVVAGLVDRYQAVKKEAKGRFVIEKNGEIFFVKYKGKKYSKEYHNKFEEAIKRDYPGYKMLTGNPIEIEFSEG